MVVWDSFPLGRVCGNPSWGLEMRVFVPEFSRGGGVVRDNFASTSQGRGGGFEAAMCCSSVLPLEMRSVISKVPGDVVLSAQARWFLL